MATLTVAMELLELDKTSVTTLYEAPELLVSIGDRDAPRLKTFDLPINPHKS